MGVGRIALAVCVVVGFGGASVAEGATPVRKATASRTIGSAKPAVATSMAKRHAGTKSPRHGRPAARMIGGAGTGHSAGISCVPYVRLVTGMAVTGNGGDWWYNAAGQYERSNRPQPGAVLAFRKTGGMTRGHVAVVSRVVSSRHLQIDHANWGGPGIRRGSVMQNVNVVDVSADNDWTTVRVQVGYDTESYGRHYPTYGFIHNRPTGTTLRAELGGRALTEIAEMPAARR